MWYVYVVPAKVNEEGFKEPDVALEGVTIYCVYDEITDTFIIVVPVKIEGLEPITEIDDIEPFTVIG